MTLNVVNLNCWKPEMSNTDGLNSAIGTDAALDFCLNLARMEAVLSRRFDHRLGSLQGLSFGDFTILLHLSRAAGSKLRRTELADRLGITASGITRTLIPLEKIGLVTRQSDPRDARVGYAALTESGRGLVGHALGSADQITTELLQDVSAEQLDLLTWTLAQMVGRLS